MTYELKRVAYNWKVIVAIAGATAVFGVVAALFYLSWFLFRSGYGLGNFFLFGSTESGLPQIYRFFSLLIVGGFFVVVFLIEIGILYGMIFFYNVVTRHLGGLKFDITFLSQEE